ncbi:MAG TPA: ROK family protein [Opitutaceae bacterium]
MSRAIGIFLEEQMAVGLVEDLRVVGPIHLLPEGAGQRDYFDGMPTEEIVRNLAEKVRLVARENSIDAVGLGLSGLIRDGIVEESPQLPQMKGSHIRDALMHALGTGGHPMTVNVLNAADALATGIAAVRGDLDKVVRVWRLGNGVGYGHHPLGDCVWEGGHTVVSLDPHETFCRCGGVGHLEGIMGHRAMRLRFLDLEPDEVFQLAQDGDKRCKEFVNLWHRALAAATASSIHMDGPGRFFITGPNSRYLQIGLVERCLGEMVRLSSLQNNSLEIINTANHEAAIIGAAVSALRAGKVA